MSAAKILDGFEEFSKVVTIPSRDAGEIPFWPWYGTQRYMHEGVQAGLEAGVHDFVVLKGARQVGGSTYWDAFVLFHLQRHGGLTGQLTSDTDLNRDYRRDVILGMWNALPKEWKYPARLNNRFLFSWIKNKSRLMFDVAGMTSDSPTARKSSLGRSKGLNVAYNDELGSWQSERAYTALKAAYSKVHPARMYVAISTARGDNVFREAWNVAQKSPSQRAIFITWWMNPENIITPKQEALWEVYALAPPSDDEKHWIKEIKRRYGVDITRGQLGWHRWQLHSECLGDENMLAQEFGMLPEECFVAFGEKFIPTNTVRRLRTDAERSKEPQHLAYNWARHIEDVTTREAVPARSELRVWDEPDPQGVYIVAAHPARSSSPDAFLNVCYVFRAYREGLVQVAEYVSADVDMYRFAWVCLYLASAYRQIHPAFLILEITMGGQYVMEEIQRIERVGHGFRALNREELMAKMKVFASVSNYIHRRADSLTGRQGFLHMRTHEQERATMMLALRNEIERENILVRSMPLVEELGRLRREQDVVGGVDIHGRAFCAALAIHYWHDYALPTVARLVPSQEKTGPQTAGEVMVGQWWQRILEAGTKR